MDYPATHPVILQFNKLPCINHFEPPSRQSCQWKPFFLDSHCITVGTPWLITGLLVHWGQNHGIQYLVKNSWGLENWPRLRGCPPMLPLCMNFLGCDTPHPLLKPASLHELTQVWGMWCTSSLPSLLTDLHTFYAFFIMIQFKKNWVCTPHSPLGPALPTLRSHFCCSSYAMKPNPMGIEQSYHSRKITT